MDQNEMDMTKLNEQIKLNKQIKINNRVNTIVMKPVDSANIIPKPNTNTTTQKYAGGDTGADTYGRRRSSKKRATQRKRKRRQRSASRRRAY